MSMHLTLGSSPVVGGLMLSEGFSTKPHVPNEAVLRGLIEKGHGLDAISTFLRVDHDRLRDWVATLNLPTPHDRPMHRSVGPKAWPAGDYFRFIENWVKGWHAVSIGEQLGRSAGAVWSKARWLGLPRRDRRQVFRPATILLPESQAFGGTPDKLELGVTTSTGERLPIRKILKRGHVYWTPELDAELANRYWANQHYEAIAAEWGLSARSIASRACRLELPRRERCKLVRHYDPSMIDANIAEARYVRRECMFIRGWLFWGPKNGLRTSKRGQKLQARSGAGYGFGIGHSIGGSYAFGL